MREIISIDFNRAARQMSSSEVFGDELIVSDLHNRRNDTQRLDNVPTIRLDAIIFFICTQGEISFHIDYKDYHLHENMLLQLNSIYILSNVRMSNDFEGYFIAISPKLAYSIIDEVQAIKKIYVSFDRSVRSIEFSESERSDLIENIIRIIKMMKYSGHAFQNHILKNETSNLLLEIANIYLARKNNNGITDEVLSRKEEAVQKFVRLVFDNCKKEHEVNFYAEQLCMTSGNLSRILKTISGKTAIKWISDTLVIESKLLLQNPNTTIQQVSEELNFGDQSSFGKFFKKHTGITPMEFRNKVLRK